MRSLNEPDSPNQRVCGSFYAWQGLEIIPGRVRYPPGNGYGATERQKGYPYQPKQHDIHKECQREKGNNGSNKYRTSRGITTSRNPRRSIETKKKSTFRFQTDGTKKIAKAIIS